MDSCSNRMSVEKWSVGFAKVKRMRIRITCERPAFTTLAHSEICTKDILPSVFYHIRTFPHGPNLFSFHLIHRWISTAPHIRRCRKFGPSWVTKCWDSPTPRFPVITSLSCPSCGSRHEPVARILSNLTPLIERMVADGVRRLGVILAVLA